MRMWGINPRLMCQQHLLGEHVEMHMFVGALLRGRSVAGYTSTGLVDLRLIRQRHATLLLEMRRRGLQHKSPLPPLPRLRVDPGYVDLVLNQRELARRCIECRKRIQGDTHGKREDGSQRQQADD